MRVVAVADAIDRALRAVGHTAVWLMPILAGVIVLDVVTRKIGLYIPILTSSRLQELEWHLHAALFSLWLGFAYVLNAHPRVDTIQANLTLRRKAWVELAGCLLFALPYCFLLVRYAVPFLWTSYQTGEGPAMPGGIPERWIIKSVFVFGLILLLLAVISMTLRLLAYLFGGVDAAQVRLPIERSESVL
jgi:TRAP-type mannitol/chloroaromatic compound transport system permease small subunit